MMIMISVKMQQGAMMQLVPLSGFNELHNEHWHPPSLGFVMNDAY